MALEPYIKQIDKLLIKTNSFSTSLSCLTSREPLPFEIKKIYLKVNDQTIPKV